MAIDVGKGERPAGAQNRSDAVVGNIEVQRAVAVNVGQRHRGAAQLRHQPGSDRDIGKMTVPVIQKTGIRPAHGRDQQIQITVPIDIRKHCAGGSLARTNHPGFFGHVPEFPVPEIFIKSIRPIQIAQINVAKAIAIVIAQRNARSIH